MSIEEIIEKVLKDKDYYERSGGGVRFPAVSPWRNLNSPARFCMRPKRTAFTPAWILPALLRKRNLRHYWKTWIFFSMTIKRQMPLCTKVLPAYPTTRYSEICIFFIASARIMLRCPLVPCVNDSPAHLSGIAALAARYPGLEGIEIMPYHAMGRDKAARIGKPAHLREVQTAGEAMRIKWLATLQRLGCTHAT